LFSDKKKESISGGKKKTADTTGKPEMKKKCVNSKSKKDKR